jgi:YfiH family protein
VEGNRSTFCRAFDLPPQRLLTINQAHGTDILLVDEPNPDLSHFLSLECDAIITNQPGIMLGILVADCYPILFWDPSNSVAAAAHVGWRGAAGGLIGKVVRALGEIFGSRPGDLYCAVGPGISGKCYEVDRVVRDGFQGGPTVWNKIASETRYGHWNLDIGKSSVLQLEEEGVSLCNIMKVDYCTFKHRELFFSYRRDSGSTGRQMGFIMIK